MLLTISTTHQPARDLGYLLHKHPDRVQEFPQSFGTATVLFPEATDERTTAALLLDVDASSWPGRARATPRTSAWRSTSTIARTPPPRCSPSPSARSSAPRAAAVAAPARS